MSEIDHTESPATGAPAHAIRITFIQRIRLYLSVGHMNYGRAIEALKAGASFAQVVEAHARGELWDFASGIKAGATPAEMMDFLDKDIILSPVVAALWAGATPAQVMEIINRDINLHEHVRALMFDITHQQVLEVDDSNGDLRKYVDSRRAGDSHLKALSIS